MFDIITFGSATKDIFFRTKENVVIDDEKFSTKKGVCFSLGSKIDVEEMYFTSGGGGTNTAVTFAKQGFSVAYCGKVGNDSAADGILKNLGYYGVDTGLVSFSDEDLTNHSIILDVPKVDRTIFVYRGASDLHKKEDIFFEDLSAKWFYLAPFSSSSASLFYELLEHAFLFDVKLMVNPSKSQLKSNGIKDALRKVDILLLNMEEASILMDTPYNKEEEIVKKISDFIGEKTVLITRGVKGVIAISNNVFYSAKPIYPEAVDRTGAGDSFGSGFLSEFMKTGDVEKSIQLGIANSTSCVQKRGAKHGLLERDDSYEKAMVEKEDDISKLKWL